MQTVVLQSFLVVCQVYPVAVLRT
uniref:Uncharacterized protein n=1 Tax=Anguilla anguilla TaxID=7936 RepID=A0A0E9XXL1_ANGAN